MVRDVPLQIVPLEAAIGVTKDIGTVSPGVDLSIHLVDFLRCVRQRELMPRLAAIVFTVFHVFIIKEQVVILEPASFVHDKVDKGFLKASMVVFNCDVEDTITLLRE